MDTLKINVQGWPEMRVRLVKKYAEEVSSEASTQSLPNIPEEDRKHLEEEGTIHVGTQRLPPELAKPPAGTSPSGVLDLLLSERQTGR
jgi:hypothetical protein